MSQNGSQYRCWPRDVLFFAKYLMWKDLVDRTEQLRVNDVVRKLLDQQTPAGCSHLHGIQNSWMNKFILRKLFTPLEADSSQIAAIVSLLLRDETWS